MPAVKQKLPFYIRYTIVVVCIVFTVIIMRAAAELLIPLFAALLLAILLLPVVKWLGRFMNEGLACFVAVLLSVITFGVVNYFLTAQITDFSKEIPGIVEKIKGVFASLQQWITEKFHIDNEHQSGYLSDALNHMLNGITAFLTTLFLSFGNIVLRIFFICVYSFFILYYRALIVRFIMQLVKNDFEEEMPLILNENRNVIKHYIVGLLAEFLIVLLLISVLLLLLGIKYALLLALITALLNVIPYIGIYTATLLAMLVTYANSTVSAMVTVGIVLLSVHLLDGIVLLPRIVGGRMKLNPFMMIVVVIIGDIVWGIPGMFLFIPLAAMLKILFDNIPSLHAWGILFGEDINRQKRKPATIRKKN